MYTKNARMAADERLRNAGFVDEALKDVDGLDPLSRTLDWEYRESPEMRVASDSDRRTAALEWLARHNRGIQAIARHARNNGMAVEVSKTSDEFDYGLHVYIPLPVSLFVRARVSSSLTCEMVPTGEVEHIAAHDRPVMERRCPESIFANLADEVVA